MGSTPHEELKQLLLTLEGAEGFAISSTSELSTDEAAELRNASEELPPDIGRVCKLLLDQWPELSAGERIAALLLLAQALLGQEEPQGPALSS